MLRITKHVFEPAIHSIAELRFLLDHLEEPPHAALHAGVPAGVNPTAITKTLTQLQELDQLQKFRGVEWAGFDAIKDSILRFLAWEERRQNIYRITGGAKGQAAIVQASQYAFDEDGSAFKLAIGADNAEMARTEILDDGSRRPFGVALLQPDGAAAAESLSDVAPWIRRTKVSAKDRHDEMKVENDGKHGSVTCSICKKAEEFDPKTRSSFLAARSRMARHLKKANTDVARHRLLYRKVFESRTTKV
jgi:hypothetical protein